jgi:hypothetical protein
MKTTATLRILFTLAVLAGIAAAPSAQVFHWEPGRQNDEARIRSRVQVAIDNAQRALDRTWERVTRNLQRAEQRRARAIERSVNAQVQAQVRQQIRRDVLRSRSTRYAENAGAQIGSDADPCRNGGWDSDYERHCEVRESTMPAGRLNVDAGQNGGIAVEGWDGSDIRVRAVVQASARSQQRAKDIADQVQVQAGGGRVYATGPSLDRRESWSVSYRISVPRKNDLDLQASNGGITIAGVNSNIRFDTVNGGVKLQDVGGRVNGQTRNGGLNVMLSGDRWDGEGLDVETSNGGVTLHLPENYNAELETRTVNGGMNFDFPVTVQGDLTGRRGGTLNTTLGSGGPLVRVRTTNGGVRVSRR